jgi:CheY-like chemotaxis protein
MRKHLLVCEDSAADSELLSLVFDPREYKIMFVSTAAEALDKAKNERFDAILLDVRLPDGSGLKVAQRIRQFDNKTPIVFHSASAMPHEVRAGYQAGANVYITKPADIYIVRETIRQLTSAR